MTEQTEKKERKAEEKPVKEKGRAKKLAGFWIRAVCFAVITVLLLIYANYVFTPKHDYGICSMMTYYAQESDTIDVLTIGTSLAYAGINTNVLWKEYGIAAYNLCSAEQPFWVSYYTLQEALKTQHPKVILLDAKPDDPVHFRHPGYQEPDRRNAGMRGDPAGCSELPARTAGGA